MLGPVRFELCNKMVKHLDDMQREHGSDEAPDSSFG